MSRKIRVPKKNLITIEYVFVDKNQRATEASLAELERVIASKARKNEYMLKQSEELAARTSLR